MKSTTVHLETSTTAFIHGAAIRESSKKTPDDNALEFRVASLRGVLRYWTRALVGPVCQNADQVFERESNLWGSTKRASRVRISAQPSLSPKSSLLLPHRPRNGTGQENPIQARGLGGTIDVTLRGPDADVDAALAILRVGLALGGIGQRSRRGAGSFHVISVTGDDLDFLLSRPTPQTHPEFKEWLPQIIRIARDRLAVPSKAAHQPGQAPFPMLCSHKECTHIAAKEIVADDEEKARAALMNDLKPYKWPTWGLPYMKPRPNHQPVKGRWASPVHFRLLGAPPRYLRVLTFMQTNPERMPVTIPSNQRNYNEVTRFIKDQGGVAIWP